MRRRIQGPLESRKGPGLIAESIEGLIAVGVEIWPLSKEQGNGLSPRAISKYSIVVTSYIIYSLWKLYLPSVMKQSLNWVLLLKAWVKPSFSFKDLWKVSGRTRKLFRASKTTYFVKIVWPTQPLLLSTISKQLVITEVFNVFQIYWHGSSMSKLKEG